MRTGLQGLGRVGYKFTLFFAAPVGVFGFAVTLLTVNLGIPNLCFILRLDVIAAGTPVR